jgi:hypothetical protein
VPDGVNASELAAICDVAVALGSTALIDAMLVGCAAIEVVSDETLMEQAVAVERVGTSEAGEAIARLASDPVLRDSLRERQDAESVRFLGPDDFAERIVAEVSALDRGSRDDSA